MRVNTLAVCPICIDITAYDKNNDKANFDKMLRSALKTDPLARFGVKDCNMRITKDSMEILDCYRTATDEDIFHAVLSILGKFNLLFDRLV